MRWKIENDNGKKQGAKDSKRRRKDTGRTQEGHREAMSFQKKELNNKSEPEGFAEEPVIQTREVMEAALEAGHILLENGAEIFRVEETMDRICHHYGLASGNAFVLSNGIFVTAGDTKEQVFAKVQHIPVSGSQLDKVVAVNQLSREIAQGKYTVQEAREALKRIRNMQGKTRWARILASGLGSGAFCVLFGGNLQDALSSAAAGLLLYLFVLGMGERLSKMVFNIAGSALVTLLCGFFGFVGLGVHMDFMIMGSVMPLIPGVPFVNAIRDMANGDYISGSVRMLDALLTFVCIAIGVGLGTALLHGTLGGGYPV